MKTFIGYSSRHGTTKQCACMLAEKLAGEVFLCDLDAEKPEVPDACDTIVVGSAIYVGKMRRSAARFCEQHSSLLLQKRLGLFLCCGFPPKMRGETFDQNYRADLRRHASAKAYFGGKFHLDEMNFLERKTIQLISRQSSIPPPSIDLPAIEQFAAMLQQA